eukprot:1161016-Pelagomonas_calceolata.AAC.7
MPPGARSVMKLRCRRGCKSMRSTAAKPVSLAPTTTTCEVVCGDAEACALMRASQSTWCHQQPLARTSKCVMDMLSFKFCWKDICMERENTIVCKEEEIMPSHGH